jgi:hypothetical protein
MAAASQNVHDLMAVPELGLDRDFEDNPEVPDAFPS